METDSRWSYDPISSTITVDITEGRADYPWQTVSGKFMETSIEHSKRPKITTIEITDQKILSGNSYYFFDFFSSERLLSVNREGLVGAPTISITCPQIQGLGRLRLVDFSD